MVILSDFFENVVTSGRMHLGQSLTVHSKGA